MIGSEQLVAIPTDDLVEELINRTEICVIGYTKQEDNGAPYIFVNHGSNCGWLSAVGMCDAIKNDIIDKNTNLEEYDEDEE